MDQTSKNIVKLKAKQHVETDKIMWIEKAIINHELSRSQKCWKSVSNPNWNRMSIKFDASVLRIDFVFTRYASIAMIELSCQPGSGMFKTPLY